MQYACSIYTPEPTEEVPHDEMAAEMSLVRRLQRATCASGTRCSAARRSTSTATATTVRVVDGRTITTDGPFAETKETLGGFYLVEAADLDEAIAFAAMIPGARHGCIEVRPVWDYGVRRAGRTTTAASGPAN